MPETRTPIEVHPACLPFLERAAALERAGEWDLALEAYDEAYQRAVEHRSPESILEGVTRLGHSRRQAGRTADAYELFELALVLADLHGQPWHAARALNGLAILLYSHGDLAAAEEAYLRARSVARQVGEARIIGEIEQNLGILASLRGDLAEAEAHYLAGLESLTKAGAERSCAATLTNLGVLKVSLRQFDEADEYLRRALEICERIDEVMIAGNVHMNRTELFLALEQPDRARASCDEAFETYSRLGNLEGQAEAMKAYGMIYRMAGRLHLAENSLRQSILLAAEARYPKVEAESQRELALVLRALNHNREALEALNRSHALFTGLQARTAQADIAERIDQLEADFLSLVRFWGESIEAKDRYTSGHCERVAEYACRIAAEVGLTERELVWFRMGAFLHDLGKTEVPEEILNKPGRLTDEEFAIMARHTVIGDEMLAPVEFPWDIRPMVRSHHERWDGRGYPDGLAGEAIPLSARILRIADVFDALTTARSYRRQLTPEEALEIMENDEGSFDPELWAVFRAIFPELVGTAVAGGGRAATQRSFQVSGRMSRRSERSERAQAFFGEVSPYAQSEFLELRNGRSSQLCRPLLFTEPYVKTRHLLQHLRSKIRVRRRPRPGQSLVESQPRFVVVALRHRNRPQDSLHLVDLACGLQLPVIVLGTTREGTGTTYIAGLADQQGIFGQRIGQLMVGKGVPKRRYGLAAMGFGGPVVAQLAVEHPQMVMEIALLTTPAQRLSCDHCALVVS